MTKRQILQRLFLRFLMRNTFHNQSFTEIWLLFIGTKNSLNKNENFELIHSFFKQTLEKEYFTVDTNSIPLKYTSKYHVYQLKKICLPVEMQKSFESIYERVHQLNRVLQQGELEIEYLHECFNEYPTIRFQIEILIQQKQENLFSLQSKLNVLKELIQTF